MRCLRTPRTRTLTIALSCTYELLKRVKTLAWVNELTGSTYQRVPSSHHYFFFNARACVWVYVAGGHRLQVYLRRAKQSGVDDPRGRTCRRGDTSHVVGLVWFTAAPADWRPSRSRSQGLGHPQHRQCSAPFETCGVQ